MLGPVSQQQAISPETGLIEEPVHLPLQIWFEFASATPVKARLAAKNVRGGSVFDRDFMLIVGLS